MFSWIVNLINKAVELKRNSHGYGRNTVIGVLDIYGFEIFDNNRYKSLVQSTPASEEVKRDFWYPVLQF